MSNILRSPNGNALHLTPRSASTAISLSAMAAFWPEITVPENTHPANAFGLQENWDGANEGVGLIVRNPFERFRSMVAHHGERSLQAHLDRPEYAPLPKGNFVRYFKFESELDAAAEWLGLPTPLPRENEADAAKPDLTPEQEARVREMFADDVALWESLQ